MKHVFLALTFALVFAACVNERGISTRYYDDCKEHYDYLGFYHKDCPKNEIFQK